MHALPQPLLWGSLFTGSGVKAVDSISLLQVSQYIHTRVWGTTPRMRKTLDARLRHEDMDGVSG